MERRLQRILATGAGVLLAPLLALPAAGATTAAYAAGTTPTTSAGASTMPASTAAAAANDVGTWSVTQVGVDRWSVTWVSPTDLPVTDARPEFVQEGAAVGTPTLAADGRTLSLEVTGAVAPEPEDLAVVLSGDVLDTRNQPAAPTRPAPYVDPAATTAIATDPGVPGSHAVTSSDYRLPGLSVSGFPAKIEVLGHVVTPTDADTTSPLVLFLHGRHSYCYGRPTGPHSDREWPCPPGMQPVPSHLGYRYIQQRLASQGYVTVSISANGINAQDWRLADGGAAARAALIRHHLAQWAAWSGSASPRYVADIRNVVLVGHSRGGEGANRAALTTRLGASFRIVGQVLLGPTDFGRQSAPYVHTVTVLPYCDGDVSDLQGQIFTDTARDVAPGDTALHSSVLMMGTNHNFFNSEWTPGISEAPSWDDWGGDPNATCGTSTDARLTALEQRKVGRTYVAGAVRLMAADEDDLLPMFDGSHVDVPSAGDADVRTHLVASGRDLRRMGSEAVAGPRGGAETQMCIGRVAEPSHDRACGRGADSWQSPNWAPDFPRGLRAVRNFEMGWTAPDQWGRIRLRSPLDLTAATSLDLRTIVDPRRGNVRLAVALLDGSGHRQVITPELGGRLPALPAGDFVLSKRWAQALRVPLTDTGSLDLGNITRVDLIGRSADGRVWVMDLAAARPDLPTPQAKRIATVSLGRAQVQEGDGPADTIARIPYTVTGPVPSAAEVVVIPVDTSTFTPMRPIRVRIRGSAGAIRIPVDADTRHDRPRAIVAAAFPWAGIMTGDYEGRLRVLDDDPAPTIELVAPRDRLAEGDEAVWKVRLSTPVDYFLEIRARFVEGGRTLPKLRVGDLRRRWVEQHLGDVPDHRPLHEVDQLLWTFVEPGRLRAEFRIPVRRDGVDEGAEVVTLRVRVLRDSLQQAIQVTDP
jgi:hypothetical protein